MSVPVPECPTCGQVVPVAELCATPGCGHSATAHEFRGGMEASKGQRGKCAHFTRDGHCKCPRYVPVEVTGAH